LLYIPANLIQSVAAGINDYASDAYGIAVGINAIFRPFKVETDIVPASIKFHHFTLPSGAVFINMF
jgi:hypothetical protein